MTAIFALKASCDFSRPVWAGKDFLEEFFHSFILFKGTPTYKFNRKAVVIIVPKAENDAMNALVVEIKLSINHRLFEQGYITEEMYYKAKEIIIKQAA